MRRDPALPLVLALLVLLGLAALLYAPALSLGLWSDDFQWLQLAHRARHDPRLLLADLDTFYRPASTWTLVLDRELWGTREGGYHLSNLVLHALAAAALLLVARRLGLGIPAAFTVAALWLASPHSAEPALAVAIRFENLLLFGWLALVLAWPRAGERCGGARLALIAAIHLWLALAKETWVVTPLLVLLLAIVLECLPLRLALRRAAWSAIPVAVYLGLYFSAFPGTKDYYARSPAALGKFPAMLAAFLGLRPVDPGDLALRSAGLLALGLAAVLLILGWRHARFPTLFGLALFLLPTLPTLFVPWLPGRYLAIPFAGFLLGAVSAVEGTIGILSHRHRVAAATAALVLASLLLASGSVAVRAEIADARAFSEATRSLVAEARAIAPSLPLDQPVLFVRAEDRAPLEALGPSLTGVPKVLFVRSRDPYGLADAAALLEWALGRDGELVRWERSPAAGSAGHAVLAHLDGGFAWTPATEGTLGAELAALDRRGARPRVLRRTLVTR